MLKHTKQCIYLYKKNFLEINEHFKTNYSGPTGEFNFPSVFFLTFKYEEIFSSNDLFTPNLMNNIRNKFSKVNKACKLKLYKKSMRNSNPFIRIIATCGFDKFGCPVKYVLTSEWVPKGNEIKLNVEQQGPILHPKSAKVKSYVSKNSRVELGHKLSCQREVDSTRLSLLVDNKIQSNHFNYTNVPKNSTLRQIKYLHTKNENLDPDPLLEVIKFRELQLSKNINYIREISCVPLRIFFIHQEALNVNKEEMNNGNLLSLYIDCTGSLFNKYKSKSPFYYSICLPSLKSPISNDKAPPITVADAILTDNSTPSIKTFLGKFLQLLEKHTNRSHQIKKVECDFSWGIINSITETFNKVDIKTYIQRSFDLIMNLKDVSSFSHFTVIHLCSSHIIKSISNNLSKITSSKKIKEKFLFCFARIQNSNDLSSAKEFFYHIVIIFLSQYQDQNFKNSLEVIDNEINNPELNLKSCSKSDQVDFTNFNFFCNFDDGICRGSPFFKYFNTVFIKAKSSVQNFNCNKAIVKNDLFCPEIFNFFLDRYLALFSMWSGVHEVHPVKNRDTNTYVENWFRIIKYNVFNENKRYNLKNFIEKLYLNLQGRYIDRQNILMMQSVAKNKTKIAKRKLDDSSLSLAAERNVKKESCCHPK